LFTTKLIKLVLKLAEIEKTYRERQIIGRNVERDGDPTF
jgi:hypothetical protein